MAKYSDFMEPILKRFTDILCGTLDNQEQVDAEIAAGKQIHPYAKHVTDLFDHKIMNRPEGHEGIYVLEESYYTWPGKEMEIKPLFFYLRASGDKKVLLQSVQIPEKFKKEEVVNANQELTFDFHDLKFRPFGVAEYSLQVTDQFTVNHIGDIGNNMTFQLIETLADDYLSVLEIVRKDGVKLTPYDTPIIYKNV